MPRGKDHDHYGEKAPKESLGPLFEQEAAGTLARAAKRTVGNTDEPAGALTRRVCSCATTEAAICPVHSRRDDWLSGRVRNVAPDSFSDHAPSVKGSRTSEAAAEAVAPRARSQQLRVEDFIREQGSRGATRGEIAHALKLRHGSVHARVRTSYVQGWIGSNGDERKGPLDGDGMQQVLLWQDYVTRWEGLQRRPPDRAKA